MRSTARDDKQRLREYILEQRRKDAKTQSKFPSGKISAPLRLCAPVLKHASSALRMVALYLATDDEVNVDSLAPFLWERGIKTCVPFYVSETRTYSLTLFDATSELEIAHYGIREPVLKRPVAAADVDLWIVPGLAFTRDGKRLGYGGGYYDRFLAAAKPSARSMAFAREWEILPDIPVEAHDCRIDEVVCIG